MRSKNTDQVAYSDAAMPSCVNYVRVDSKQDLYGVSSFSCGPHGDTIRVFTTVFDAVTTGGSSTDSPLTSSSATSTPSASHTSSSHTGLIIGVVVGVVVGILLLCLLAWLVYKRCGPKKRKLNLNDSHYAGTNAGFNFRLRDYMRPG